MASFVRPDEAPKPQPRLSKWEKADIRTERRSRASKHELMRENIADKLRCPLCFCLPCVVIVFILLILIGIYVVRPYVQGTGLVSTGCVVTHVEFFQEGSCSHRTEKFGPCVKIFVMYDVGQTAKFEAVLMENEQALAYCEKCSFTFGNSDLFGRYSSCAWNSDLTMEDCVPTYMELYGTVNNTFSCYYDPENTEDVARILKISSAEAVCLILFPLLFLLLWLLAIVFLVYDNHLRSVVDEQIIQDNVKANKYPNRGGVRNGGTLPLSKQNGGLDLDTSTIGSVESTAVSANATPRTRRRRKKKMPCARQHYQFDYLDEGILLEDKPLSYSTDHPYSYSFVTVDTSPMCTCNHNGFLEAGFDRLPQRDLYTSFTPAFGTPNRSYPSRYSGRPSWSLPESFV